MSPTRCASGSLHTDSSEHKRRRNRVRRRTSQYTGLDLKTKETYGRYSARPCAQWEVTVESGNQPIARRSERMPVQAPVTLRVDYKGHSNEHNASTVDLSKKGVRVRAEAGLLPGQTVTIVTMAGRQCTLPGRVVWIGLDGTYLERQAGIEFLKVAANNAQVRRYLARGGELSRMRSYAEAEQVLRAALELEPDNPDLHFELNWVLNEHKKWELPVGEYRPPLRPQPDDAAAHYNLGLGLDRQGDLDGAVAEYRIATRLQPDFAEAHDSLGTALDRQGDLDGAVAEYSSAIRLQPDFAEAHDSLGTALARQGDLDGAVAEYRTAIRLQPDFANAHYHLGSALARKGDLDGTVAEYRTAIRLKPDFAWAHALLGLALETKGDRRAPLEELRTAHLLNPKNSFIAEQYERLLREVKQ